jgi:hypothetical protein
MTHHQLFLEHWALPNKNTSLDPNHKIETNVLLFGPLFQLLYIHLTTNAIKYLKNVNEFYYIYYTYVEIFKN